MIQLQRENSVDHLKQDIVKTDKRMKALKERMKKISAPVSVTDSDKSRKGSDDVFEEEEENE